MRGYLQEQSGPTLAGHLSTPHSPQRVQQAGERPLQASQISFFQAILPLFAPFRQPGWPLLVPDGWVHATVFFLVWFT